MPKYKVFAAMELGSAAVIMKIAQMSRRDGIKVIDSVKYDISLGSEVYRGGKISAQTIDEICQCLERCAALCADYSTEDQCCYATTAVREASNKDHLIDQIKIRCGLKVRIISAAEESFLHNKAFALDSENFDNMIALGTVIVDVNSGNTQVSYYDCSKLVFSQKMPIGSLRALELLNSVNDAPVGFAGLLEDYISMRINNDKQTFFDAKNYAFVTMTGSQAGTLKKIIGSKDDIIDNKEMDNIYKLLKDSSPEELSEKYSISIDEAELLFPTALIYKMFIIHNRDKKVMLREVSTADGMCVEYAEKNCYTHTTHRFTNDIISAAEKFAAKFNVNEKAVKATMRYAEAIFNAAAKKVGLTKQQLLLLKLAVLFADTGKYVNLNGFAKNSCLIVKANPIPGLREKQQNAVAYAVGMLEGEIDYDDEYKYLPSEEKVLASKLCAMLAAARAIAVSDTDKIGEVKASVRGSELRINVSTKSDITLQRHAFETVKPFFKEVLGLNAVLKQVN